MARVPVIFSGGLDRASGAMAAEPSRFHDLRNLYPRDGKLVVRGGLASPGDAVPLVGASILVAVAPFRAIGASILVGYSITTRELSVWKASSTGGAAVKLGTWATLAAGAPMPQVFVAEAYGKLFLAHDEALYNFRAATAYLDSTALGALTVQTLRQDFDGVLGAMPVRFRGVVAHAGYLFGWGYGTEGDPNRPEIVRVSLPADPLTFDKQHYYVAGHRNEPVLNCTPAGGVLVVSKRHQRFRIVGTDRRTFGIEPVEQDFGVAAGRLAVTVGDRAYVWTDYGPRATEGGASTDLAVPLELDGPQPADLAEAGELEHGFAVYEPTERAVLFAFPVIEGLPGAQTFGARTRVYALSVRDPSAPRWTYQEYAGTLLSAGVLTRAPLTIGAVSAYPVAGTFAHEPIYPAPGGNPNPFAGQEGYLSSAFPGYRQVRLSFDAAGHAGDEVWEVWGQWYTAYGVLKPWTRIGVFPASSEVRQHITIEPLQAWRDAMRLKVRAMRSGQVTAGYENANPMLWDGPGVYQFAIAMNRPIVTKAVRRQIGDDLWELTVEWESPEYGVGYSFAGMTNPASSVVTTPELWQYDGVEGEAGPRSATVQVDSATIANAPYILFRVRGAALNYTHVSGTQSMSWLVSDATDDALTVGGVYQSGASQLAVFVREPEAGVKIEVAVASVAGTGPYEVRYYGSAGGWPLLVPLPAAFGTGARWVRVRPVRTVNGVDEPGSASIYPITLLAGVPAAPTDVQGARVTDASADLTATPGAPAAGILWTYGSPVGLLRNLAEDANGGTLRVNDIRGGAEADQSGDTIVPATAYSLDGDTISAGVDVNVTMSHPGRPINVAMMQALGGVPYINVSWEQPAELPPGAARAVIGFALTGGADPSVIGNTLVIGRTAIGTTQGYYPQSGYPSIAGEYGDAMVRVWYEDANGVAVSGGTDSATYVMRDETQPEPE